MSVTTRLADPVLTDELWALIEPFLPVKPRRHRYPGRYPLADRAALSGLLIILARQIPFENLPQELGYGCGMSCWRRMRRWQDAGVWLPVVRILIAGLPDGERIDWRRAMPKDGAS